MKCDVLFWVYVGDTYSAIETNDFLLVHHKHDRMNQLFENSDFFEMPSITVRMNYLLLTIFPQVDAALYGCIDDVWLSLPVHGRRTTMAKVYPCGWDVQGELVDEPPIYQQPGQNWQTGQLYYIGTATKCVVSGASFPRNLATHFFLFWHLLNKTMTRIHSLI